MGGHRIVRLGWMLLITVVLAAGGRIVTLDGEPLAYNLKESFLNPEFLVIADDSVDWLAAFRDD